MRGSSIEGIGPLRASCTRPLTRVLYDDFARKGLIDVSVENRSDVDIFLRRARILFGNEVGVFVDGSIPDTIRDAVDPLFGLRGGHGTLVRARDKCTLTFSLPDDAKGRRSYVALISWRRHTGLAAPTLPLFVRLQRPEP